MNHFLCSFIHIHWKKSFLKRNKNNIAIGFTITVLFLHKIFFLHIISVGLNCFNDIFIFRLENTLANKVSQYQKFLSVALP